MLKVERPQELIEIFGEQALLAKEAEIFESVCMKIEAKKDDYLCLGERGKYKVCSFITIGKIQSYYDAILSSINNIKIRRNVTNGDLAGKLEMLSASIID